jgi:2-polyprenyl-3-methyl-5-hydroxy-6-metoxy-1,4-benzoquinol methylase
LGNFPYFYFRLAHFVSIAVMDTVASAAADCQASYDRVADEYMRRIFDELQHKPFDRELLDQFSSRVRESGPVCDLGCGPGHVTKYLHEHGVDVSGMDLSPAMVDRDATCSQ